MAVLHPAILDAPNTHAAGLMHVAKRGIVGVDQCEVLVTRNRGRLPEQGTSTGVARATRYVGLVGLLRFVNCPSRLPGVEGLSPLLLEHREVARCVEGSGES